MGRRRISFQLYELGSVGVMAKQLIQASGGVVYVAQNGDAQKRAITDKDGTALTNPRALTNGACEFYVPDTVSKVDLYIMCPGGQFAVVRNVDESIADIGVDVTDPNQVAVIPFSMADMTVAEVDTLFDLPNHSLVLPHPAVQVSTIDATETWDFGLLSSETAGDADGFLAQISVGTAGLVQGLILNGGNTMGALFERQDSINAGDLVPAAHAVTGSNARSITITPSAGSDTAEGFFILPYILCNPLA